MIICIDGHCYDIVIVPWPWSPWKPGPGPVNYPALLHDATLVASVESVAQHAADDSVRVALQGGIDAAIDAMRNRAADGVEIQASTQPAG
jgi:hypothetical protein